MVLIVFSYSNSIPGMLSRTLVTRYKLPGVLAFVEEELL